MTGASGFIGRHCLPLLVDAGCEVHAAARHPPRRIPANLNWHATDLLDTRQVSSLLTRVRPSHLLHLAWYVAPGKYQTSPENLPWVQATLDLLQAFARSGGQRVVMAGSCLEYDWRYGYCSENLTPLLPRSIYGACKHAVQVVLSAFAREAGLSSAWGRIFFLFGPHESPTRLVSSIITSLLREQEALCTHGQQIRDFLYVKDAAAALVALLRSGVTGPVNIASGQPRQLRDIACTIGAMLGRPELIRLGALPAPDGEPPVLTADVTRLREEVGWSPDNDLIYAIGETIDWWRNHEHAGQVVPPGHK